MDRPSGWGIYILDETPLWLIVVGIVGIVAIAALVFLVWRARDSVRDAAILRRAPGKRDEDQERRRGPLGRFIDFLTPWLSKP